MVKFFLLNKPSLGPWSFWFCRLFLISFTTFCVVNILFVALVLVDNKRFFGIFLLINFMIYLFSDEVGKGPNGLVHRKLEDMVYNQVHGEQNLFEDVQKKVIRKKFLFISYSNNSLFLDQISNQEQIFMVNVNQKVRKHDPSLDIYWGKVTRTNLLVALSLIR